MSLLERIPELACPECKGSLEEKDTLRCRGCGAVFGVVDGIPYMLSGDMKAFAEEIAVQDRVAVEYELKRYRSPYAKRYHDWWTDLMLSTIRTDGRILDNGCGAGLLLDRIDPGRVVGLDLSSEMLKRAAQRTAQLVLGNSEKLPLQSQSFDAVFCRSLLHHLPQPAQAIEEMHRILRPGGEVVSVDTNRSLLSVLPRMLAGRTRHFSSEHKNFNARELVALFNARFTVKAVRFFGYVGYPILGFPDLIDCFKYFPAKELCYRVLMGVDETLARIPLVRSQAWAMLITARKR